MMFELDPVDAAKHVEGGSSVELSTPTLRSGVLTASALAAVALLPVLAFADSCVAMATATTVGDSADDRTADFEPDNEPGDEAVTKEVTDMSDTRAVVFSSPAAEGECMPVPPEMHRSAAAEFRSGEATTGAFTNCPVAVPGPGYPYLIHVYGSYEAGHFPNEVAKPIIPARLGTPPGRIVGRDLGSSLSDWNPITVIPDFEAGSSPAPVGPQIVRTYGTSAIDTRHLRFSAFMAGAYAETIPVT